MRQLHIKPKYRSPTLPSYSVTIVVFGAWGFIYSFEGMAPSKARQPKLDRTTPSDTSMTDGINEASNAGEIRTGEEVNHDVTIYPFAPFPLFAHDPAPWGNGVRWGHLLS